MRLHCALRASVLNVYSTGPRRAGVRDGKVLGPRTRKQPMEWDNGDRALISGDEQPVPGNSCDSAMRARWKSSECAAMSRTT